MCLWHVCMKSYWYVITSVFEFWICNDCNCLLVFWIYYYDFLFHQLWLCWYVDMLVFWINYDCVCFFVMFGSIMIAFVCWYFGFTIMIALIFLINYDCVGMLVCWYVGMLVFWINYNCVVFVMFGSIMIVLVCWYFGFTIMIAMCFLVKLWLCCFVGILV